MRKTLPRAQRRMTGGKVKKSGGSGDRERKRLKTVREEGRWEREERRELKRRRGEKEGREERRETE